MKKITNIIQWSFAIFFWFLSLGTGSIVSSAAIIIAGLLMAPIKPIREFLKKIKIKSSIAIVLSVIIFFGAIIASPAGQTEAPSLTEQTEAFTTTPNESVNNFEELTDGNNSTVAVLPDETQNSYDSKTEQAEQTAKNDSETNLSSVGNSKKPTSSSIPAYSGKIYITLNNNTPNFSKSELTTKAYESYSPLDSLGRCGVATASLGKGIMPKDGEKRGSISSIKPSGWVQAQYDFVSGKYLYNRCHLIGWQLSAENANVRNLITGTRYFNTKGMLPFENMVADYINETENHVAYRVTPIFEGDNLVAKGVQIEAYSVEDDGEGICFNVFCYNVQNGVEIDYATGSSKATKTASTTKKAVTTTRKPTTTKSTATTKNETTTQKVTKPTTTKKETTTKAPATNARYICNTNSQKFHYPSCQHAKRIKAENRTEFNGTRDQLISKGYSPCGICDP